MAVDQRDTCNCSAKENDETFGVHGRRLTKASNDGKRENACGGDLLNHDPFDACPMPPDESVIRKQLSHTIDQCLNWKRLLQILDVIFI